MSLVWNSADKNANITLSSGDRIATATATSWKSVRAVTPKSSGKWYFEVVDTVGNNTAMIGVMDSDDSLSTYCGSTVNGWSYSGYNGYKFTNNSSSVFGTGYAAGDTIGVAIDFTAGKIWFAKNNTWQNSGNPAAGTNEAFSSVSGTLYPTGSPYGAAASLTIAGETDTCTYAPPSGFDVWSKEPWDGTVDTPEISTTTSVISDIKINIDTPENISTTTLSGDNFTGRFFSTPEVITNINAESDVQLRVNTPGMVTEAAAISNLQLQFNHLENISIIDVSSNLFTGRVLPSLEMNTEISMESDLQLNVNNPGMITNACVASALQLKINISEIAAIVNTFSGIFVGIFVWTPEVIVNADIISDIQLNVFSSSTINTTRAEGSLHLQVVSLENSVTTSMIQDVFFFTTEHAETYYLFTLTGAADSTTDIEIPISSFQCRKRSGTPTYLSVVIPDVEYAEQISDRANGTLQIEMAYKQDGVYLQRAVIVQGDLDSISIDEGGSKQSITLTGYKTETFVQKTVMMKNPTYRSVRAGSLRYRFAEPNITLQPGDIAKVGSDTYTADLISYAISADSQQLEVSEA